MAVTVKRYFLEQDGVLSPAHIRPHEDDVVKVKRCGNHLSIEHSSIRSKGGVTRKISKDEYVDTRDGLVKQFTHKEKRIDDTKSVSRSLKNLRDRINTNTDNPENCKWLTLTYRENMTDTKKLYNDFKNFIKRLHKEVNQFEYISMVEPQARGAWHCHVLLIFAYKAPFIQNELVETCWKQGFVKTKALDNIDNVGAYLTAYLGDIPLDEASDYGINGNAYQLKDCERIDDDGNMVSKKVMKGARMHFYPAGMQIARYSRGLKKPVEELTTADEADKEVSEMELTYETTKIILDNDSGFLNIYNMRVYKKNLFISKDTIGEENGDNEIISRIPPIIYEKPQSEYNKRLRQ